MKFRYKMKQVSPHLYKKVLVEEPEEKLVDKKMKMRYEVNSQVFDIYDSVADNAKMISLIFALLSRIYDALPKTTKGRIPQEERDIIEYAFQKYHSIETKADVELKTEGRKLIDKLMDRQHIIGEIYKMIYKVSLDRQKNTEKDTPSTNTTNSTTNHTNTSNDTTSTKSSKLDTNTTENSNTTNSSTNNESPTDSTNTSDTTNQ